MTSASRGTETAVRSALEGRLTSTGVPTSHCGFASVTRTSNWRERSSPTGTTVLTVPVFSTPCSRTVTACPGWTLAARSKAAGGRAAVGAGVDARVGVGGVAEPHGGGTDLHVLASLDEALGHDAGERCPNHRLTDLVLRLP